MAKNVKEVEFNKVSACVSYDLKANVVTVTKSHFDVGAQKFLHEETHQFDLRTMPLSVVMQMVSAIVTNIGLVEYEQ